MINLTEAVEALNQMLDTSDKHLKGRLVFSRPNGAYLTRDIVKHPFERVIRSTGLHRIRIHDTRHSYASQLVMEGVALKVVAEYLGHSTTKTTEMYAHLSPAAKQSYVDVLDDDSEMLGAASNDRLDR